MKNKYTEYSKFWLGDTFSPEKVDADETYGILKLAAYRRAISNFVYILTGKNIPVRFAEKTTSMTDGNVVYIGGELAKGEFDPTVGLALHEASHIVKSDFSLIKTIWGKIPHSIIKSANGQIKTADIGELIKYTLNDLTRLQEHQDFLLKLLTSKDSFVRKKIIDQNLSYLNSRLTHYLDRIGLPHTVKFQNDLSVMIEELGRELDFDNLSRGERNRLILSLSWSFRDVWEGLYQPINLLFIDEMIDSGMDTSGVENAMAILKKMSRERNKSIFLVSHKDELAGRVNNVLMVTKEAGFTTYGTDIEIKE